jgi:hypothetical protein
MLRQLNMIESAEFLNLLQKKLGVSDAQVAAGIGLGGGAAAPAAAAPAAAAAERMSLPYLAGTRRSCGTYSYISISLLCSALAVCSREAC